MDGVQSGVSHATLSSVFLDSRGDVARGGENGHRWDQQSISEEEEDRMGVCRQSRG